jgi:hypothetical protein
MPDQEVTAVSLHALELFRQALFDPNHLSRIVAGLTVALRVTAHAHGFFSHGECRVMSEKGFIVTQEGHGLGLFKIGALVARGTACLVPLLLVLMAGEAGGHVWKIVRPLADDAAVTGHTLAPDPFHRQVSVVVERDLSIRSHGFGVEYSC